MTKTLRIFISSPSDVRPERAIAERVIARLDREFSYHFRIEPVLWEREPLRATEHFQDPDNIPQPRATDIVVVILWGRLGVELPAAEFKGAVTGRTVTGTEWEFEDAVASYREDKRPDMLLYRKTAELVASLSDEDGLAQMQAQKRLVDDFMTRWFQSSDGTFKAASHLFADAAEFEDLLYAHLQGLVRKRLPRRSGSERPPVIRWEKGSPFRGLASFDLEHAPVFYGRTRARNELREALARRAAAGCAFVLVFGASGSGKSSLVKAGLLADLKLPGMIERVGLCRHAIMRPSDRPDDPVAGLAAAMLDEDALPELVQAKYTADRLGGVLKDSPQQIEAPLEAAMEAAGQAANLARHAEARLVVVVDQLEELFTSEGMTEAARRQFVTALGTLARSGSVYVVATMRSDFFDRLEGVPELLKLSAGDGRYLLAPPNATELAQIVRGPAAEAGCEYEANEERGGLDEAIGRAATGNPDALPLLEYLLDQLWRQRTESGTLTFDAYDRLGGLEGALGARAEAVFETLDRRTQGVLPSVLRTLVTAGSGADDRITARAASMSSFSDGGPKRALVDAFLSPDSRLLTVEGDGDGARVRIAHEALLSHWSRARRQIESDRADLQTRAQLEQGAAAWKGASETDKPALLLNAGLPLSQGEDLLDRRRDDLPPDVIDFVETSGRYGRAQQRRRVRRLQATAAGFGLLALAAGIGGYYGFAGQREALRLAKVAEGQAALARKQEAEAKRQAELARERQTAAETARRAAQRNLLRAKTAERTALQQANAANSEKTRAQRLLVSTLVSVALAELSQNRPRSLAKVANAAGISLDSFAAVLPSVRDALARIAEGAPTARPTETSEPLAPALVDVAPDLSYTVRAVDNRVQLFVAGRRDGIELAAAPAPVRVVRIGRGGCTIIAGLADGRLHVWRLPCLQKRRRSVRSPILAMSRADISGAAAATINAHAAAPTSLAFGPRGHLIASAAPGEPPKLWRIAAPHSVTLVATLRGAEGTVRDMAFDPWARDLVAVTDRGKVHFWSLDGATRPVQTRSGTASGLTALAVSPDGRLVATAGNDRMLRLWSRRDRTNFRRYRLPDAARQIVFAAGGEAVFVMLATGRVDKLAFGGGWTRGIARTGPGRLVLPALNPAGPVVVSSRPDAAPIATKSGWMGDLRRICGELRRSKGATGARNEERAGAIDTCRRLVWSLPRKPMLRAHRDLYAGRPVGASTLATSVVRDLHGRTPFLTALWTGLHRGTALPPMSGEVLTHRDDNGETALHYAARFGPTQVMSRLLANGADVEARNDDGMTPLMLAARAGRTAAVEHLLGPGKARPDARSYAGESALAMAIEGGHSETVAALRKQGAKALRAVRPTTARWRARLTLPSGAHPEARAGYRLEAQSKPLWNSAKAIVHYRRAAAAGDGFAMYRLASYHFKGKGGVTKDLAKAVEWAKRSAAAGSPYGLNYMGFLHKNGYGVEKSDKAAFDHFRKAAEKGSQVAMVNLAIQYRATKGPERSNELAFAWFSRAAKAGRVDAAVELGKHYLRGWGVDQSFEKAAEWLRVAAGKKHPDAIWRLGWLYEQGVGGLKADRRQAIEHYARAAALGSAEAQYRLGWAYETGFGAARDPAQALIWLTQAASRGHGRALERLGRAYLSGDIVTASTTEARSRFLRAASVEGRQQLRLLNSRARTALSMLVARQRSPYLETASGRRYRYDTRGRPIRLVTRSWTRVFDYHPTLGKVSTVTTYRRSTETRIRIAFRYDDRANLVEARSSDGRWIRLAYGPSDLITKLTASKGRALSFAYENQSKRPTVIAVEGIGSIKVKYGPRGRMRGVSSDAQSRRAARALGSAMFHLQSLLAPARISVF